MVTDFDAKESKVLREGKRVGPAGVIETRYV